MLVYGAQRTQKHSGTVLLNIVVGLCSSIVGFLILGRYLLYDDFGGLVGDSDNVLTRPNTTNTWQMNLLLQCCFANSIALIQLHECATLETFIFFSLLFSGVVYPLSV